MSDSSVEEFMLGMASQLAEREDAVLCSDVRDKLFGPNEFSRRDLGALNIMRGRDNGLADYNTVSVTVNPVTGKRHQSLLPEHFATVTVPVRRHCVRRVCNRSPFPGQSVGRSYLRKHTDRRFRVGDGFDYRYRSIFELSSGESRPR